MHSDFAFTIGSTHEVCQDYAMAREDSIILCDGCTSSEHTDIGARILSHVGMDSIKFWIREPIIENRGRTIKEMLESFYWDIMPRSESITSKMQIANTCLDATVLMATAVQGRLIAAIHGDGAIILKDKSGVITVHSVNYSKSFPFYPNYMLSNARMSLWKQETNNEKIITSYNIANGVASNIQTRTSDDAFEYFDLQASGYDFIALTSDGVTSFFDKGTRDAVDQATVLSKLMDFKSTVGKFVVRKLNAFSKRDMVANNWSNADDVSLAAICLSEIV